MNLIGVRFNFSYFGIDSILSSQVSPTFTPASPPANNTTRSPFPSFHFRCNSERRYSSTNEHYGQLFNLKFRTLRGEGNVNRVYEVCGAHIVGYLLRNK